MRTKIYLLLIALVATIGSVWGQDFEVDGVWYRELSSNTVAVVMPDTATYGKYLGDVVVPATITSEGGITYNVTEIAQNAFRRCHDLTSITIEGENLESIGIHAFYYSYNLKTITIPKSVTFIQSNFVDFCESLESIIVAAGNTVYDNYNDDGVLYNTVTNTLVRYPIARSGNTYVIPAFVEGLEISAFMGCVNLPSITVPKTVVSMSTSSTSGQFQSIYVEDGHDYFIAIDGVLFSKDEKTLIQYPLGRTIPDVYHVPATVTTLASQSFHQSSLREIHLPNTITAIPNLAFRSSTSLEIVTGLENVLTIGNQAFDECYSLKNFELPKNLTSIGVGAFLDCYSFSGNIEIPKTVTTIGNVAFGGCFGIESFSIEDGNNAFFATDESGALYTATSPKKLIQYPPANKQDSYTVPDDVEVLDPGSAFRGAEIGILTLSKNLTAIDSRTFQESKIGVLIFTSDTPPASLATAAFDLTSEDMIIMSSSKDPAVIAAYVDFFDNVRVFFSEYIVTLDYNDGAKPNRLLGSDPATRKLRVELETPSRSGYDFGGWYDDADDKWVAGTVVSSDITLTARWAVTPTPPVKAMYTVTITPLSGVRVNKTSTTIGEGNSFNFTAEAIASGYSVNVFVNGSPLSAISGVTYLIEDIRDNKVVTFSLVRGTPGDGTTPTPDPEVGPGLPGGPGQIIIDENSPSDLPGTFPPTGEIIVYPPVVEPGTDPSVTIDGEEVPGRWDTDEDGNPIFVIDYDNLEDGEHTLVIGDKEYTFTTNKNGGATSNDVLSTAKVIAGYGNITIETPKSATVQVVSFSGSVVYNAKVTGTTTVNVPAGIYAVVVDGTVAKVVVR